MEEGVHLNLGNINDVIILDSGKSGKSLEVISHRMEYSELVDLIPNVSRTGKRKPHVLLAASGSVAAIKFENLCRTFSEWAEVRAVATQSALNFLDTSSIVRDIVLYTDEDEWATWSKIGDAVLHIELRKWADLMVIAPLSANTLGKIAGGLCDNLLTCIVRAWDYNKPIFVAPAMNTFMWNNPFTEQHISTITELGISLIPPVTKTLACGDYGNGAMAEPSFINTTVRLAFPHEYLTVSTTDPHSRQGETLAPPQ